MQGDGRFYVTMRYGFDVDGNIERFYVTILSLFGVGWAHRGALCYLSASFLLRSVTE
ncbi:hypothetical protein UACE39S_05523 [Ureibacillus acetophenoni]